MGSSDAGRQTPSCIATLLYCERGACGPDGAGGWLCCSSAFFSESRRPPLVGGVIGEAPPGCDCVAGAVPRIEVGLRSAPAIQASAMLVRKNRPARTAVVRVSRFAVPRLRIKPAPPAQPKPPPLDLWR